MRKASARTKIPQAKKPKRLKREPVYSYTDCRDYLQSKFGYDERDYAKSHNHFQTYIKETGDKAPFKGRYPKDVTKQPGKPEYRVFDANNKLIPGSKDIYNKQWKLIHDHYKRYQKWTEKNPEPEYQNFWHWVAKRCDFEGNGSTITFSRDELKEMRENGTPQWVCEIYERYLDAFQNSKGELEMLCTW